MAVPLWFNRLRIQCGHCSGLGCCCGTDLITGLGTSTCCRKGKKKKLGYNFLFVCFLGPNLRHMEGPRLGVKSELQLLVHAIATATWDLNLFCDLHHTAHSNSRSQTHWVSPGTEPTSSRMLVGFVSAAPQQELPNLKKNQDDNMGHGCSPTSFYSTLYLDSLASTVRQEKEMI